MCDWERNGSWGCLVSQGASGEWEGSVDGLAMGVGGWCVAKVGQMVADNEGVEV